MNGFSKRSNTELANASTSSRGSLTPGTISSITTVFMKVLRSGSFMISPTISNPAR